MSNASSSEPSGAQPVVPWKPWIGVLAAFLIFLGMQFLAGILISVYPLIKGWSTDQAQFWLDNSLNAKLIYLALFSALILGALNLFLKKYKTGWSVLGLRRPKGTDPLYSLAAFPVYVGFFVIITAIVTHFVTGVDINQAQDLGFNGTYHGLQLILIAIGLVVLPPIVEEIIFRGLLYGSLRKAMPVLAAAMITSLLFAGGHLTEGQGGSLLYIAAIDTLSLSLILVYLREKTGGLWAGIGLHAIKNGIAFVSIFVIHAR